MGQSIKLSALNEIPGGFSMERLPDNRNRVTRLYNVDQVTATMFDDVQGEWGTPDAKFPACVLVPPLQLTDRRIEDSAGRVVHAQVIIARFEELPDAPTETVSPEPEDLPGYYKAVTCIAVTGTIANGSNVLTVSAQQNWALGATVSVAGAGITNAKVDAMDSTGLIWTLSASATANVSGAAVTGNYTRFAREWTTQLIVAGAGNWPVAKNTEYFNPLPSGGVQRYFVGEAIQRVGLGVMSIIVRKYCELPDSHSHPEQISFTRPGSLGAGRTPTTLLAAVTVTRSYSLGTATRVPLGYDPKAWATEYQEFHVAGDTGGNQFNQVEHSGYLADGYGYTLLGGLNTFNGLVCDVVSVSSASDPATTPTGTTIISSEPGRAPWKGDIWERVNISLDWSQF